MIRKTIYSKKTLQPILPNIKQFTLVFHIFKQKNRFKMLSNSLMLTIFQKLLKIYNLCISATFLLLLAEYKQVLNLTLQF